MIFRQSNLKSINLAKSSLQNVWLNIVKFISELIWLGLLLE